MELMELQNLWLENNRKLDETLRLNREIMNKLLKAKPERRLTRIKAKALINLILPIVILSLILFRVWVPDIKLTCNLQFYIGVTMFGIGYVIIYILSARYYWHLMKIDFTQNVIDIKTRVLRAEACNLKTTRFKYLSMPFAITGILMLLGIPIFSLKNVSLQSFILLFLIVLVFIGSVYVTFKFTVVERFRKLKQEISELEKLTKEND
jgi:hypothetical protein